MENNSKRIYLSLPISGYDIAERRATALAKKEELEKSGWSVVNPLENGLPVDAGTRTHMKRDIELLLTCDAIYLMGRWNHSAGCQTEFLVATAIGLEFFFEEVNITNMGGSVSFV